MFFLFLFFRLFLFFSPAKQVNWTEASPAKWFMFLFNFVSSFWNSRLLLASLGMDKLTQRLAKPAAGGSACFSRSAPSHARKATLVLEFLLPTGSIRL